MDLQRFQLLFMLDSFVHQASKIAEIIQLVDLYVLVSMMQVILRLLFLKRPTTWSA